MKKLLMSLAALLLLSGCATIKLQQNIINQMETYVFNAPPGVIYAAAEDVFSGMYVPLESTGQYKGESKWLSRYSEFQGKQFESKQRFIVEVKDGGNNRSLLRVYIQAQSKSIIDGKWEIRSPARSPIYEYSILQKVDPAAAAIIDKKAAAAG